MRHAFFGQSFGCRLKHNAHRDGYFTQRCKLRRRHQPRIQMGHQARFFEHQFRHIVQVAQG